MKRGRKKNVFREIYACVCMYARVYVRMHICTPALSFFVPAPSVSEIFCLCAACAFRGERGRRVIVRDWAIRWSGLFARSWCTGCISAGLSSAKNLGNLLLFSIRCSECGVIALLWHKTVYNLIFRPPPRPAPELHHSYPYWMALCSAHFVPEHFPFIHRGY